MQEEKNFPKSCIGKLEVSGHALISVTVTGSKLWTMDTAPQLSLAHSAGRCGNLESLFEEL